MMMLALTACFVQRAATCNATCSKLYGEECNIARPGRTQLELEETCQEQCKTAMARRGDVGSYDPYERAGSDQSVELENRAQAEL